RFHSGLMSCQPTHDYQNRNAIRQREQTKMKAVLHNADVCAVDGQGGLVNAAQRSVKPDNPRTRPPSLNVVPEPNLPPLPEPGNGVYILLCDAARSTEAVPSQSRPTSVSREGQSVNNVRKIPYCHTSSVSDPKTASLPLLLAVKQYTTIKTL